MTAVPPGQYPPFATVTDEDHSAWIIIATALGVSFAFVALATRIFIRKFVNPAWALDDTVLGLATVGCRRWTAFKTAANSSSRVYFSCNLR